MANDFRPWFPYHEHFTNTDFGEYESEVEFSRLPLKTPDLKSIRLSIPSDGLREEVLWHAMMQMLLGFSEPRGNWGFRELQRAVFLGDFTWVNPK